VSWGVGLAVLLAVTETWAGIALAYVTDWPTSFWIVLLSCGAYFLSLLAGHGRSRPPRDPH
jgi:zinc/manganese transport system permease protein